MVLGKLVWFCQFQLFGSLVFAILVMYIHISLYQKFISSFIKTAHSSYCHAASACTTLSKTFSQTSFSDTFYQISVSHIGKTEPESSVYTLPQSFYLS